MRSAMLGILTAGMICVCDSAWAAEFQVTGNNIETREGDRWIGPDSRFMEDYSATTSGERTNCFPLRFR